MCSTAQALGKHFATVNYDRRGHGDSGDGLPEVPIATARNGRYALHVVGSVRARLLLRTTRRRLACRRPRFLQIVRSRRVQLARRHACSHLGEASGECSPTACVDFTSATAWRPGPAEKRKKLRRSRACRGRRSVPDKDVPRLLLRHILRAVSRRSPTDGRERRMASGTNPEQGRLSGGPEP
jgi:hypothetical protein